MPSTLNKLVIEELSQKFQGIDSCIFVDFTGLGGRKAADLRNQLHATCGDDASFTVVKATLAKRALLNCGCVAETDATLDECLVGPTGIAYGADDPAQVARIVAEWGKKEKLLKFKGGLLSGRTLDADAVTALSKIPPKPVLMAQVVGTIAAPLTSLLGVAQGPIRKLLGLADAMVKAKNESEAS